MKDQTEALVLASDFFEKYLHDYSVPFRILGDEILETKNGWVVTVNTETYLETNDIMESCPISIYIRKDSGGIHTIGTARPLDYYLKKLDNMVDNELG